MNTRAERRAAGQGPHTEFWHGTGGGLRVDRGHDPVEGGEVAAVAGVLVNSVEAVAGDHAQGHSGFPGVNVGAAGALPGRGQPVTGRPAGFGLAFGVGVGAEEPRASGGEHPCDIEVTLYAGVDAAAVWIALGAALPPGAAFCIRPHRRRLTG